MAGSETLKELVAAAKEREGTVLDAAERSAPYSYREFATNCFKAGTLLGHYGVHPGAAVTVAVGPKEAPVDGGADAPCRGDDVMGYFDAADPLLAIFGGASVGAAVDVTPMEPVESRALVAPAWRSYETAPRCSTLAYGGPPDDPAVAHFEAELWSENPTAPPESVAATDPALRADGESYTHETLLAAAADVVDDQGFDDTSRVVLSARLTEPGALVAGVLAPLSVGATIRVADSADPNEDSSSSSDPSGTTADTDSAPVFRVIDRGAENCRAQRERVVDATTVTESLRAVPDGQ